MWNDNEGGLALGANHLMGYKLNVNNAVFFFFFFLRKNKPGSPPVSSGTLGRFFHCFVPCFSHLLNGGISHCSLIGC